MQRNEMDKDNLVEKTRKLLIDLGMDKERSNERSAMVFLALAHLDSDSNWTQATNEMYTTRQLMDWIRDHLGQDYAANTRETIRRFTLHQFSAGAIVEQNADQPDRPINSPKWNYRLTPRLIPVIHAIGTKDTGRDSIAGTNDTWNNCNCIAGTNDVDSENHSGKDVVCYQKSR